MSGESTILLNGNADVNMEQLLLDGAINTSDGRVPFYRGELFLNIDELNQLNARLAEIDSNFGKPLMVEVKTPPLVPITPVSVFPHAGFTALPIRATRTSVSGYLAPGGKSRSVEKASVASTPAVVPVVPVVASAATPTVLPQTLPNTAKIQSFIGEVWSVILSDPEYSCLSLETDGCLSLNTITGRIGTYGDHFQFSHDILELCQYWLQGPPSQPQYMSSLKLLRTFTDLMTTRTHLLVNDDYYAGPNVDAAIAEGQKEEVVLKKKTTSPSFARKVRKAEPSSDLKSIEQQVAMLTQHVMGLHQPPSTSMRAGESTAKLNAEEVSKLESDLMKLSPDDIDHVVSNILKDEPSVRVDDESYELDVGALPGFRQRALRRFVTRRLNAKDPGHGANRLKQMLRDDELAKASEEMAERLLQRQEEDEEPEEHEEPVKRTKIDQAREEEARRLWQLAHGDDDEDME